MSKSEQTRDWVGLAALFIAIIGSSLVLAFKIGVISEKVTAIEKTLEDLPKMKTDITEMQVKLDVLWRIHLSKSTFSMKLNANDIKALKTSEIDQFVNNRYPEILLTVESLKPDNATQAQELLISVVNRYKRSDEYSAAIHKASLSSGYDVDSLLLIAAVSIGPRMVSDLGFKD